MTRSMRSSRCHHYHHPRRGSYGGDGSFNEKYGFSTIPHGFASLRSISVSFQPLAHDMELESIYDDGKEDEISLDFSDSEEDVYPKSDSLQTSLRSAGVSIRSLPREIELREEEDEDNMSIQWTDLQQYSRGPPTMWDLQTSLRTIDAGVWSLPRELELGSQEEPNYERSYNYASSRTSFVKRTRQHRNSCSPSSAKLAIKSQEMAIDELVGNMADKLLVCTTNRHIAELPRAA